MIKPERVHALKKKVLKRAKKLKWKANKVEDLPKETYIALQNTGNIAIPKRSDRKRFGKSSGKRFYGHYSGFVWKHLDARSLRERAHGKE